MKNIGILGGTFNPIHNGHIMLAKTAYEQFDLDKILVMVSKTPPHKDCSYIVSEIHRSNMVKLAIKDYPYMEFSDFELTRDGKIYTAETLTLLKEANPDTNYYFIIGGDSIRDFHTWFHPEIVLKNAVIIAALRDNVDKTIYNEAVLALQTKYKAVSPDIRFLETDKIDISSTKLRENLREDSSLKQYINEDVYMYIKKNNLY